MTISEPLCLVLELCSSGDLHTFLRRHANLPSEEKETIIPWETLLSFAWQIADGMIYLDQKGIIHRDISARNILIHEDRIAKIGDFGLSRCGSGNPPTYTGKGGRLPVKWMALEAI